jgi:hypothetical protein
MRKFSLMVVFAAACTIGAGVPTWPQGRPEQAQPDKKSAPTIAGKWIMTLEMAMGTATPALELKQDGGKITGTYTGRYGTFPLEGSLKDHAIAFSFTMDAEGQSVTMSFQGEVSADAQSMKGTATLGEMGDATWSARRQQPGSTTPTTRMLAGFGNQQAS